MRIPSAVKVGGMVYAVQRRRKFDSPTQWGRVDHALNTIQLSEHDQHGAPAACENVEQTFMHEILHVVDHVYNSEGLEEDAVERLSHGLYQVLKDNGLLAEGE